MGATQIILLITIVILVVLYPILTRLKNKKDIEKLQEQTDSLKKGVKVMTTSGVYGTVVELLEENEHTIVVIETGSKDKKGYIAVEAFAIYTVFDEEQMLASKKDEIKPAEIERDATKLNQTLAKTEENLQSFQKTKEENVNINEIINKESSLEGKLKKIDELKNKKVIGVKEYNNIRKEVLNDKMGN